MKGPACVYSDISEPESESASLSRFAADAKVLDVSSPAPEPILFMGGCLNVPSSLAIACDFAFAYWISCYIKRISKEC